MGVSRNTLIAEANKILAPDLKIRGYILNDLPYGEEFLTEGMLQFSFDKPPQPPNDTSHSIVFLPFGFSEHDLFDLSVTLYRYVSRGPLTPPETGIPLFSGDLARFFLDQLEESIYRRWHFVTVEEVRKAYADILARLFRYGIPLLENPEVNWDHWMGRKPFPSK